MRRIASFVLLLALGGCGYHTWWNLPFTAGNNPNAPVGNSETMRRVMGEPIHVAPLKPQVGDVWPGPLPPTPTLQDLEKQTNLQPLPEQAAPGSPLYGGAAPNAQPSPAPAQARGSSTPPPSAGLPPPIVVPPAAPPSAAVTPPPAPGLEGKPVHTLHGTGSVTGGSQGYQTMTMPNGSSAIVIPNGNGTSTVIQSNGTIETIPTPR